MPDDARPEGDRQERWRGRRHRGHRGGLLWGPLLILLGVLFLAANSGWISGDRWWQYFLVGLGVIFLIDALVYYASPGYRRGSSGRIIPGVGLIFIGLAFIYGWSQWWPLVLIAAGVAILFTVLLRRR